MLRYVIISFTLSLSLSACSFDPDLGSAPFRCDTAEPRCPDGYACIVYSPTSQICEVNDSGEGGLCDLDANLEPNETIADATATPLGDFQETQICNPQDVDIYSFAVQLTGQSAEAIINHDSSQGALRVQILNVSGQQLALGTPDADNPDIVTAVLPNAPAQTYFVQVDAAEDSGNEYDLIIRTQ